MEKTTLQVGTVLALDITNPNNAGRSGFGVNCLVVNKIFDEENDTHYFQIAWYHHVKPFDNSKLMAQQLDSLEPKLYKEEELLSWLKIIDTIKN